MGATCESGLMIRVLMNMCCSQLLAASEANTMEDVELPLPLSADVTARLEIRQAELLGLLRGMEIGLNNIDAFKHTGGTR